MKSRQYKKLKRVCRLKAPKLPFENTFFKKLLFTLLHLLFVAMFTFTITEKDENFVFFPERSAALLGNQCQKKRRKDSELIW